MGFELNSPLLSLVTSPASWMEIRQSGGGKATAQNQTLTWPKIVNFGPKIKIQTVLPHKIVVRIHFYNYLSHSFDFMFFDFTPPELPLLEYRCEEKVRSTEEIFLEGVFSIIKNRL